MTKARISEIPSEQDEQRFGAATYQVVRSDTSDPREWLQEAPVSRLLKTHHIVHAGVMQARHPFRVSRINPNGAYMMACMEGRGQVLVDGRWESLVAGQGCLLPPFVMNRFQCLPRVPWKFCWVRYAESRETPSFISSSTPVMGAFAHEPLLHAILGLRAEAADRNDPQAQEAWVNLLHHYVMGFAQPQHRDERIVKLWQVVERDLARAWTLEQMADLAHVSHEHLRRLCRQHLGRSPLQQLTFLRMQRAQQLLNSTSDKIETIAHAVGYENAFTFSTSYKKWIGWRPSEHR
jgi:AraC-like DNA-binding protein